MKAAILPVEWRGLHKNGEETEENMEIIKKKNELFKNKF